MILVLKSSLSRHSIRRVDVTRYDSLTVTVVGSKDTQDLTQRLIFKYEYKFYRILRPIQLLTQ